MHVLPFLVVSAVVVVTPGVDMALVTKNALLHGRAAAQATAVGINLGIFVWTIAAALGLAALIAASATAFTVVKLAGAAYLVYLGIQTLRGSRTVERSPNGAQPRLGLPPRADEQPAEPEDRRLLHEPPPPVRRRRQHRSARELLLLGALFNLMGLVWLLTYAALAARGRDLFRRPGVRRAIDRITGVALIALGVRLAFERRH